MQGRRGRPRPVVQTTREGQETVSQPAPEQPAPRQDSSWEGGLDQTVLSSILGSFPLMS